MAQAIAVEDIRKSFGAVEALKGVSLYVDEGEKVVVIGPSARAKACSSAASTVWKCPTRARSWWRG